MSRVLVIGDTHEPVCHNKYLRFGLDLYDEYECDTVLHIGDVVDWHSISFHAAHPQCPGPEDEYKLALMKIKKWHTAFPKMKVCIGNHDARIVRLAESVDIPSQFIRDYSDVWKTEGWDWQHEFIIDDVYYFHGTGMGGVHPAYNTMSKMLMSVVMGHCHSRSGIKWKANPTKRIFGMDVGCGIDVKAWQFAYGRHVKDRPILSAGVVLDGIPYHEVMPIGKGERYD